MSLPVLNPEEACFCTHPNILGCNVGLCQFFHIFESLTCLVFTMFLVRALYRRTQDGPVKFNSALVMMIYLTLWGVSRILYHIVLWPYTGWPSYFPLDVNHTGLLFSVDLGAGIIHQISNNWIVLAVLQLLFAWLQLYNKAMMKLRSKTALYATAGMGVLGTTIHVVYPWSCGHQGSFCSAMTNIYLVWSAGLILVLITIWLVVGFKVIKSVKESGIQSSNNKLMDHLNAVTRCGVRVAFASTSYIILLLVSVILRSTMKSAAGVGLAGYDATPTVEHLVWHVHQMAIVGLIVYYFVMGLLQGGKGKAANEEDDTDTASVSRAQSGSVSAAAV